MKRIMILTLLLALVVTLLTGCKGKGNVSDTDDGTVDGTNNTSSSASAAPDGSTGSGDGIGDDIEDGVDDIVGDVEDGMGNMTTPSDTGTDSVAPPRSRRG